MLLLKDFLPNIYWNLPLYHMSIILGQQKIEFICPKCVNNNYLIIILWNNNNFNNNIYLLSMYMPMIDF